MVKDGTGVLEILERKWNCRENTKQQKAVFFGDRHSQVILLFRCGMAAHPGSSLDSEMGRCIFHLSQEGGRGTEQT